MSRDPVGLAEGMRLVRQAVLTDSFSGPNAWAEDGAADVFLPRHDFMVVQAFFYLCVKRRWWQLWRPRFNRWQVEVRGYDFSRNGVVWAYISTESRRIKVRTAYLWMSEELMMFKAIEATEGE